MTILTIRALGFAKSAAIMWGMFLWSSSSVTAETNLPLYSVRFREYAFDSCNQASRFLSLKPLLGQAIYEYEWPGTKFSVSEIAKGDFVARASFALRFKANSVILELPQFAWPRMSDADKAWISSQATRLRAHEEGHLLIAERVMRQFAGPLTASGTSSKAAKLALSEKTRARKKSFENSLASAQVEYDILTEHGRHQERAEPPDLAESASGALTCTQD